MAPQWGYKERKNRKSMTPAAPDALDTAWSQWNKTKKTEDFDALLDKANPVIDRAVHSLVPGAPPPVYSKAKVLAAKAIKTYNPERGAKLATHLHTQLKPLQREIGTYSTLYAPERVRLDSSALDRASQAYESEHGYLPSDQELADYTKLSKKRIQHIRGFKMRQTSDAVFEDAADDATRSLPATERGASLWEEAVYQDLNPRDRTIYELKTGRNGAKPVGVSQIAKKLKISPSAVSQRLSRISVLLDEGLQYESGV